MEKLRKKVIIFISFVAMGFVVVTNINQNLIPNVFNMKAVEYKEIIEERNNLYKEIERLSEENSSYNSKINEYKSLDGRSDKIVEDMKNQVADYSMVTGTRAVSGPGLVVKIEDGDINTETDTAFETWRKILHDNDMALVINEIRNAGAEAIAINSHRMLNSCGVICRWAFIGFEDQTMEYAPFYIYVIGDPEQLEATLLSEGSYIQELILRSLKIEITKRDKVIVPASNKDIFPRYMEEYLPEEKIQKNKGN